LWKKSKDRSHKFQRKRRRNIQAHLEDAVENGLVALVEDLSMDLSINLLLPLDKERKVHLDQDLKVARSQADNSSSKSLSI
jgi:hypothetical protein